MNGQEHLNLRKCDCGRDVQRRHPPLCEYGFRWVIYCPMCGIVMKSHSRKGIVEQWNKGYTNV